MELIDEIPIKPYYPRDHGKIDTLGFLCLRALNISRAVSNANTATASTRD